MCIYIFSNWASAVPVTSFKEIRIIRYSIFVCKNVFPDVSFNVSTISDT